MTLTGPDSFALPALRLHRRTTLPRRLTADRPCLNDKTRLRDIYHEPGTEKERYGLSWVVYLFTPVSIVGSV